MHLVSETLEGRGLELKEYSVGVEVFNRGADFDPRTDAVVRVSVGQLRRRLAAYYTTAGTQDDIVINIPKGHYWAEFNQASRKEDYSSASVTVPLSDVPVEVQPILELPAKNPTQRSKQTFSWPWLLAVALVVALPSFWLGLHRGSSQSALSGGDIRKSLFWSMFLEGDPHAVAVIGVATTASIGPVVVRMPSVNDAGAISTNKEMQKIAALFGQSPLPYSVYTGIGDAIAAARLEHAFAASSLDLPILPSKEVRFSDLHSQNVVFISSLRFRDLHSSLDRKRDFEAEDIGDDRIRIVNHAPRAGEQSFYYSIEGSSGPSTDYALISILPGTESDHRIMEVGGTATLGTAGAAQYLTEAASLSELDGRLRKDRPAGASSVQVLLRVDILDNQIVSVHYATHHWIR
ncbi:MAG TPA: hypothetical protein VM554_02440 [Acidisarcina sp.]|nr:hypothetical protein [Acidisarcina sp.]